MVTKPRPSASYTADIELEIGELSGGVREFGVRDLETLRASRTLREIKTAAVVEQGRGGLATSGGALPDP